MSTTQSKEETYLTRRVLSMQESQTMRISNLANKMKAEGMDIVSLSAGEPDFPTPDNVNQAAIAAIMRDLPVIQPIQVLLSLKQPFLQSSSVIISWSFRQTRLLSVMVASRLLQTPFLHFAKRAMKLLFQHPTG